MSAAIKRPVAHCSSAASSKARWGRAGEAVGRLVEAETLEPGTLGGAGGRGVVLLLRRASGDEEVGAAGPGLRGVILAHALPHLSHLGAAHSLKV